MRSALGRMLGVLGTGVLIAASFPPFGADFVAWVALVPLLAAVGSRRGVVRAFLLGVGGTLPFFVGVAYGLWPFDRGLAVAFPAVLSLVAGGVLAARTLLADRPASPWLRPLVLPSLWILAEYATTALGIPWALAISQTRRLVLVQAASVVGMSGISFLVVLVNVAVYEAIAGRRAPRSWHPAAAVLAAALLGLDLVYGAGCLVLREGGGRTLRVATIQPMLASDLYSYQWLNPEYGRTVVGVVDALSATAAAGRPDLLVWPENGNGLVNFRLPSRRAEVAALARRSGATLVLSSYDVDESGRRYNAVFSVAPDGTVLGRYAKVHLAPGGERGFSPGSRVAPLPTPHGPVGALVCLESCLPWVARSLAVQGAVLLVVTTSDVSMRASAPPLNHARFAVFRAVENRRAVVQASNGGPSELIDPYGAITDETGFLARTTLEGDVELAQGETVYTRLGDGPLLTAAGAVLVAAALGRRRRRAPRRIGWTAIAGLPAGVAAGLAVAVASLGTIALERGETPSTALATFLAAPPVAWPTGGATDFREPDARAGSAAALAYALHVLGLKTRAADLLPRLPGDADVDALAAVARAAGLRAWGAQADLGALRTLPKPVVAETDGGRWVVVLAASGDHVDLFDPAVGFVRAAMREFQAAWGGTLLIIRYGAFGDGDGRVEERSQSGGGDAAPAAL